MQIGDIGNKRKRGGEFSQGASVCLAKKTRV
jgi:hypothetical protein